MAAPGSNNIGEVVASLRAEVGEYIGPMKQAAATNKQFQASTTKAMTPLRGAVVQFKDTGQAAKASTRGVRSFNRDIARVGVAAAGIRGPMGTLLSNLGGFAAGGGLVLAASLGIKGISEAMKFLASDTRQAKEELEELRALFLKIEEGFKPRSLELSEQAGRFLRRRNQELQTLRHMESRRGTFDPDDPSGRPFVSEASIQRQQALVDELTAKYLKLRQRVQETLAKEMPDSADKATKALRKTAKATEDTTFTMDVLGDQLAFFARQADDYNAAWDRIAAKWREEIKTPLEQTRDNLNEINQLLAQGRISWAEWEKASKKALEKPKEKVEEVSDAINEWQRLVADSTKSVVDTLVHGIIEGEGDLADAIFDTLKRAIEEAISLLITKKILEPLFDALFNSAAGGGGATGVGGAAIGSAVGSVIPGVGTIAGGIIGGGLDALFSRGQPGGAVVVPISQMPQPPVPSAAVAARDQYHGEVWRETARLAQAQGFRLVIA